MTHIVVTTKYRKQVMKLECFYDDALTELVNHYANRTLIVSCTKDNT